MDQISIQNRITSRIEALRASILESFHRAINPNLTPLPSTLPTPFPKPYCKYTRCVGAKVESDVCVPRRDCLIARVIMAAGMVRS